MKIILASASLSRQQMLKNAGVNFEVIPASIPEEKNINQHAVEIALNLARQKALYISEKHPQNLIIGSDQVLEYNGQILSKPLNHYNAFLQIKSLQNNHHRLFSAVAIALNNKIIWADFDSASLYMKKLRDQEIEEYLTEAGEEIFNCVGSYQIEKQGSNLFTNIIGDNFTIMGMPLLRLLTFLKDHLVDKSLAKPEN